MKLNIFLLSEVDPDSIVDFPMRESYMFLSSHHQALLSVFLWIVQFSSFHLILSVILWLI